MAKYQVLKRTPHVSKDGEGNEREGQMIEFTQIPDSGVAQVQWYFVADDEDEEEILGIAAQHHEDEIKAKGISYPGMLSPMNGVPSNPEPIMKVTKASNGDIAVAEDRR